MVDIFNAFLERLLGVLESRHGQTQSVFTELCLLENLAKTNTSAVWSHTEQIMAHARACGLRGSSVPSQIGRALPRYGEVQGSLQLKEAAGTKATLRKRFGAGHVKKRYRRIIKLIKGHAQRQVIRAVWLGAERGSVYSTLGR